MAALSQDDRDIIARHPLGDYIQLLHTPLRDAEQSYTLTSSLHNAATDGSGDNRRKIISFLLDVLMTTDAALFLKVSSRRVTDELFALWNRVREGDFNYDCYRPLARLIIQKEADFEVWSAVFNLITTLSEVTPPPSVLSTFGDTPIRHSSASQQGSEQTRWLLEARVFEEIKDCTYRDVEGFYEKYFEGKGWTRRASDVYQAMKDRHAAGKWTDLPESPTEDQMLDWLFRLQHEFLSKEPRRYYTTKATKELTGAESRRQIDLLVKRNTEELSDTSHDFRDFEVIGELKQSNNDRKATLLQISRYVRDVFACQSTRRYVHAFTICGREMEVWIFDRSGLYSPGRFDIHDEPKRFIQVIAGYTMMNEDELGLDTFMERDVDGCFISLKQDGTENLIKIQLEPEPFVRQRAIVCRGTSCFRAKILGSNYDDCVAKFSWTSKWRQPESDLLQLARRNEVKGIAELVGHHSITSVAEMRSGLKFGKPYSFRGPSAASSSSRSFPQSKPPSFAPRLLGKSHGRSTAEHSPTKRKSANVIQKASKQSRSKSERSSQQQNAVRYDVESVHGTSLDVLNDDVYDQRVFRCLVIFPAGRAIHQYKSKLELLEALRDAIKAHESLYRKGKILHRDISENNIIITDLGRDGFRGMLIDLDLAKELGTGRSGARCRTGTMEFMAIEVLQGISHTYRHDLESFLYVLVFLCGHRGWEYLNMVEDRISPSLLTRWYVGSYREIASAKRGHMQIDGFEEILSEFPPLFFDFVKPLCRELRKILFPSGESGLFVGTPKDPKNLYDPIIKAFDKAIGDMIAKDG